MRGTFIAVIMTCAAGCGPPECLCLSPEVWVDVCAAPQKKVQGEIIGGVEECAIEFDVVGAFAVERRARFTNPGKALDVALDITIESDAFTIVSAPTRVEPKSSADAVFRIEADTLGDTRGVVIVTTDAANILGDTIEIELSARADSRTQE